MKYIEVKSYYDFKFVYYIIFYQKKLSLKIVYLLQFLLKILAQKCTVVLNKIQQGSKDLDYISLECSI